MQLACQEQWFAVQVLPQHEKTVSLLLEIKGYQYFLPLYKARRQWSDRTKILLAPLFPGYLFLRSIPTHVGSVRGTPGMIRVVSFGGKPYPITDDEIDALRTVVDTGRNIYSMAYFAAGQKVQVKSGPLAGIKGIITRTKNQQRLVISVEAMMKSVSVEISSDEVMAA
jgi:transcription antitermination factor NusG